jgi:hypothetical protein
MNEQREEGSHPGDTGQFVEEKFQRNTTELVFHLENQSRFQGSEVAADEKWCCC